MPGQLDPGRAGGYNQGPEIETKDFPTNHCPDSPCFVLLAGACLAQSSRRYWLVRELSYDKEALSLRWVASCSLKFALAWSRRSSVADTSGSSVACKRESCCIAATWLCPRILT